MTIDVIEIGRYLVATLRADTALRSLMGITTNDPRVYLYYSGSALIDPAQGKRAYITYAQTAEPERTQAVGGPVFSLAVWADNMDTAAAVAQRLKALLDKEGDAEATVTAGGIVYQPVLVGSHFSSQENTKFAGIQMQFRFGFSHV
ncbi:MAG TPA: hypothetical protein VFP01_11285 [Propionibacteriaceae bacterium]|nr:hypothetical protein [Propionibacteriaceae bacterium]